MMVRCGIFKAFLCSKEDDDFSTLKWLVPIFSRISKVQNINTQIWSDFAIILVTSDNFLLPRKCRYIVWNCTNEGAIFGVWGRCCWRNTFIHFNIITQVVAVYFVMLLLLLWIMGAVHSVVFLVSCYSLYLASNIQHHHSFTYCICEEQSTNNSNGINRRQ